MHCTGVTAEAKLKERLPNIYRVGGGWSWIEGLMLRWLS